MSKIKRVLVTGASGFVGRHVCKLLVEDKCEVYAIVRKDDQYLKRLGVQICIADLWDAEKLRSSLAAVNYVIHCAGDAVFGNGEQYKKNNLYLTKHILNEIKTNNLSIDKFVYISTIGAIDRGKGDNCSERLNEHSLAYPTSDYGVSKLNSEELVKDSGLKYVIIRPSMVVGSDMRKDSHFAVFVRYALSNSILAKIDWPGSFSVVDVDDLASAIGLATFHPHVNSDIIFCAGEEVKLGELFKKINPENSILKINYLVKLFKPIILYLPFKIRAMLLPALVASDAKLRKLGWHPKSIGDDLFVKLINREAARINPKFDPNGQTVITGAASGLGLALLKSYIHIVAIFLLLIRMKSRLERWLVIFQDAAS